LHCGTCQAPKTCGGGGNANRCGCTPKTCDALGAMCGNIDDGCGTMLECGACPKKKVCSANLCVKE
jgi:hypothetical protein